MPFPIYEENFEACHLDGKCFLYVCVYYTCKHSVLFPAEACTSVGRQIFLSAAKWALKLGLWSPLLQDAFCELQPSDPVAKHVVLPSE